MFIFRASSPYVLACGGTQLASSANETVWSQHGATGGVSECFPRPGYQQQVKIQPSVLKRGLMAGVCVAGLASPGYNIPVHGKVEARSGTGAAAPLWAGITCTFQRVYS